MQYRFGETTQTGVVVNGDRISILLIDNNQDFVFLIRKALSQASGQGIEITQASRLSEALQHISTRTFDAIVLDISLPETDQFDAFTRIRRQAPETPIVVLTADDNLDIALQTVRRGAQDYLVKGRVTGQLLSRSLRYAIERQQALTTLRRLSLIDELTGLYNRRGFLALVEQHINLAQRQGNPVVLVLLSVLDIAHIAEQHGQDSLDAALIRVAEILRSTFRSSDILARLENSEFIVLAFAAPSNAEQQILNRLQMSFGRLNAVGEFPFKLQTATIVLPVDAEQNQGPEALLEEAARRMKHRIANP
jgi:two-component system, cell cycle response regulator